MSGRATEILPTLAKTKEAFDDSFLSSWTGRRRLRPANRHGVAAPRFV